MNLFKLQIKTINQRYPIIIGNNILSKFSDFLKKNSINFNQCLLVVDSNVPKRLINKVITSLHSKKKQSFFLTLMKKIKIKKVLIKFYLFF